MANMNIVKLFAKKGYWFKAGSEVFNEYNERFSETEINKTLKSGCLVLVRGVRICSGNPIESSKFCVGGQEYEDLAWCGLNEFDIIRENI